MSKIVCGILVILMTLTGCGKHVSIQETSVEYAQSVDSTYRIDYTFTLLSNDSVGNEWQTSVTRDGQILQSGDTVTAPENTVVTLTATVTEIDQYPDTASVTLDIPLEDGGTTTTTITVLENGGAYINHASEWEVTCSVTKTA